MQVWLTVLGAMVGAVGGSFSATAALRSLEGRQALSGRSACDACHRSLGHAATVPIASYLLLKGRCRGCNGQISIVHPIGETLGLLAGAAAFALLPPTQAVLVLALALVLLGMSIIDCHARRLPDRLTLTAALLAAMLGALAGTLLWGVVAAALAVAVLEGVRRIFKSHRGDVGLGLGDVKLIAALALWLGVDTPWAIVLASLLGLIGVWVIKPADGKIAFGPAIAAAAMIVGLTIHQTIMPIPGGGHL